MNISDLILLFVALVGSGFYSGMETGVVSINRLRLHHLVRRKVRGAAILQRFVDDPDALLGTTLVGTNICNVLVSVTSASIAIRWMGPKGAWVAGAVTTLVVLIAGEYLPKAWFRSFPAYRALPFAVPLLWSERIFYPLSKGLTEMARLVIPSRKSNEEEGTGFITREELEFLTGEGDKTGTLTPHERQMMNGVFSLTRKMVKDTMVPRTRMAYLEADTQVDVALAIAREKKFSRYPVWDKEQKRFIGILNILDLISHAPAKNATLRDYVRPPQYVSAHSPADKVLPRMQLSRQPMALVTNRHGDVIGVVTTEDLLKEIVGQL